MNTLTSFLTAGFLALSFAAAQGDPKTEVKDAVKKLKEETGFSWTSTAKTVGSDRRQGPIEGKAEKGGLTYIKGTSGDNSYEAAFKGDKSAVNFAGEWMMADALGDESAGVIRRLKAFKNPVEEADALASKAEELKKESDGLYAGDLTADAAKEMFSQLGRRAAEAPTAKGSVKFWVKDGLLSKYEVNVQGKITVGGDKREVDLSRTATVELKDIGSTKISLPDEIRKKFTKE
jgi:hypothetical protein